MKDRDGDEMEIRHYRLVTVYDKPDKPTHYVVDDEGNRQDISEEDYQSITGRWQKGPNNGRFQITK